MSVTINWRRVALAALALAISVALAGLAALFGLARTLDDDERWR